MVKMRVTITFEYDADPDNYAAADGDPLAMAQIDHRQISDGDPFTLAEFMSDLSYDVTITPSPTEE